MSEALKIDAKAIKKVLLKIVTELGLGSKKVIGIDIGGSSIKIAELSKGSGGSLRLVHFASVPLPEAATLDSEIQRTEDLIAVLKEAHMQGRFSSKNVCLGISGKNTAIKKLQLAVTNDDEIEDQIYWEAEQYIPFPIEESFFAFHKLEENSLGGVDIILAAAKQEQVISYKELLEAAEMHVKVADISTLALNNIVSYVLDSKINLEGVSWIFMDFGAQLTRFIIFKDGHPVFTREIPIGGSMVTEEIQRKMGMTFLQAEDLKTRSDENGNLPEEVVTIIKDVFQAFFQEIGNTLEFYFKTAARDEFGKCFITGGSIHLPGFKDELATFLGVTIEVFNPFERIECVLDLGPRHLEEIGVTGAVALGLAMRGLDK